MKRKQVYRYYCDFCRKSKGTKNAMEIHERHCTMNPNRACRMCYKLESDAEPMSVLIACLPIPFPNTKPNDYNETAVYPDELKAGIEKLREASGNCPVCMLAALRQRGHSYWDYNELFDYTAEIKRANDEVHFCTEVRHDEVCFG
jgi:hypothetical protein